MNRFAVKRRWLLGAAVSAWCALSPATVTADVNVAITTTPHGGQFAPKNVVAAWVEDANGVFIKTISRWSNTRTSHLIAWLAKAGNNDVDAVSGATRLDHTKVVTATWDLKNKAGNEVPDGTYTVRVELADSNSSAANQNDQGTYTFVKGAAAQRQDNVKSGGFTTTIVYTPQVSPTCNNGQLDAGETCDPPGSCPTSCADSHDSCMPNTLVGSATSCTAKCVVQAVTACVSGDGCCPSGCDAASDADCASADGTPGVDGGCATGGAGAQLASAWALVALAWLARRRAR